MLSAILSNKRERIYNYLEQFKQRGRVLHAMVLQVPTQQRITALAAANRLEVIAALCANLKLAIDQLNLRVTVNEDQVLTIAEAIIDESCDDNLALEDVLLFLDGMIKGKYGRLYDRLDMATFFELFEVYREQRHQTLVQLRYEQDCQYRALGDAERWSENHGREYEAHREALGNYLKTKYNEETSRQQE